MTPVFQTVVDKGRGNCHQAAIASLFDLELSQVPNFRLFPDATWFNVYWYFIYALGYEHKGSGYPDRAKLREHGNVNGFVSAVVPSKTFGPGTTHAVILDLDGLVVHDPNSNQRWMGINVVESGELLHW